jgi:hypothetical protein
MRPPPARACWHAAVAETLPRPGRIHREAAGRVDLVCADCAVLHLDRDGQRKTWLLTAFVRRDSGGPDGAGGVPPSPTYAPEARAIGQSEGARLPLDSLALGARAGSRSTQRAGRDWVAELDTLIPSQAPDGRVKPACPHTEGAQPRDRSAAPSQDQLRALAAMLIPDRLRTDGRDGSARSLMRGVIPARAGTLVRRPGRAAEAARRPDGTLPGIDEGWDCAPGAACRSRRAARACHARAADARAE